MPYDTFVMVTRFRYRFPTAKSRKTTRDGLDANGARERHAAHGIARVQTIGVRHSRRRDVQQTRVLDGQNRVAPFATLDRVGVRGRVVRRRVIVRVRLRVVVRVVVLEDARARSRAPVRGRVRAPTRLVARAECLDAHARLRLFRASRRLAREHLAFSRRE